MAILKKIFAVFKNKPNSTVKNQQGKLNPVYEKWVQYGSNNYFQNMVISNRGKSSEKKIYIGNNSVLNGTYIFENDHGKISIGDRTFIGGGSFICIDNIYIGNDVLISWGCTFMDNNAHSLIWDERKNDVYEWKKGLEEGKIGIYKNWSNVKHTPIKIEDKAWIGFNCIILKGVTIGEGAVVAAGSTVTTDIPPYTVFGGNPAKMIKSLK